MRVVILDVSVLETTWINVKVMYDVKRREFS